MSREIKTIQEICELDGLTVRHQQRLVKSGESRWERVSIGKYALKKDETPARPPDEDLPIDIGRWRAKKEMEIALIKEFERKRLSGDLIPADAVLKSWKALIVTAKSRLLNIPKQAAARVSLETDAPVCEEIIDDAIREALDELAIFDVSALIEVDSGNDADVESAAETDGQRVRKRKSKTPRRKQR